MTSNKAFVCTLNLFFFQINQSQDCTALGTDRRACRSLSVSGDIYHGRVSGQQTLDFNLQTPEISLSLSLFLSLVSHLQPHH